MKLTKTLLCAAVAGAMAFALSKASAAPLYVTSLSARITVTTNYTPLYTTNIAKYLTKSVNLKQVMKLITNGVYQSTGTNPPADVKLAWNPYATSNPGLYMYLTNSSGYYASLNSNTTFYAYAYVEDIATSFKLATAGGGSEKDSIVFYLDFWGDDLNGDYFEIYQDYGTGTLAFKVADTGIGKMTIKSKGGGYGSLYGSDDGVSYGSVGLTGTLTALGNEPYSLWWY